MLKDLKNGHFWALYHNYWMIKNFPGKSGRVTVLTLSPSDFMPSFGKILGAVIRNFWPLPSRAFCLSQVLAQLKLRTAAGLKAQVSALAPCKSPHLQNASLQTFQPASLYMYFHNLHCQRYSFDHSISRKWQKQHFQLYIWKIMLLKHKLLHFSAPGYYKY